MNPILEPGYPRRPVENDVVVVNKVADKRWTGSSNVPLRLALDLALFPSRQGEERDMVSGRRNNVAVRVVGLDMVMDFKRGI